MDAQYPAQGFICPEVESGSKLRHCDSQHSHTSYPFLHVIRLQTQAQLVCRAGQFPEFYPEIAPKMKSKPNTVTVPGKSAVWLFAEKTTEGEKLGPGSLTSSGVDL